MDPRDFAPALAPIPRRRDQLLPALHAVHGVHGWLPQAAIEAAARHVFVPLSEVYGIVTSYSELRLAPPDPERVEVCTGLSCRIAGADAVVTALAAQGRHVERVACRFLCAIAPVAEYRGDYYGRLQARGAVLDGTTRLDFSLPAGAPGSPRPMPSYGGEIRRVGRRLGQIDPTSLPAARAAGAYTGLARALTMPPAEVVELVRAAGLRGRGGAYFPTHIKWSAVRNAPAPRYLVVNAEEGEPGVFKDRCLMEGDPHALVEGSLIAAYACGAERVVVYVNGQAALSADRLARAVADARAAGLVGADILGSGFACDIALYRGAGGYVAGEESVILNSIEGERAVPRFRPPLPTERGLFGRPTVINNVETLVNVPLIVTEGAAWFRSVGTDEYPGTKLISLSGAVRRPGLYEVPMGTTIRTIVEECGAGALPGHTVTAAVVGGPSGGLLPAALLDIPIQGGPLHPSGAVLGAGGIVVLDERTPVAFALRELTAYNKEESCGKCTPCREGTARALAILDRAGLGHAPAGESGPSALSEEDRATLLELCDVMQTASLCGLGQMAPGPIRSALTLFGG
jgi:NADH-quinone oxidoreductase subunit F